jgi:stearoyl-CoA desaturase (delta-9 desaturase)
MDQAIPAQPEVSPRRPWWNVKSIPFLVVHLIAAATLIFGRWSWGLVALAIGSYYLRMFAITAGYHRYFAHRTYKTSRAFQFFMAMLGTLATQKGPLWWAAHHRDHHKYSDQPEDIHSPVQRGLWWSHVGWVLSSKYDATKFDRIKDFASFPELRWLNQWYYIPVVAYASAFYFVGGWSALLWGYFVSTMFLWHGTFLVNSLAHVFGRRRYVTTDDSRNSFIIAMLTMGEGWHNNHHHYQSTTNQGWFWWEIDMSYYVLRALSVVGLVSDLRTPPRHIRDGVAKHPAAAEKAAAEANPAEVSEPVIAA